MASRAVSAAGLCWPEEAVYDADGMFRGFVMPEASGEPLGTGLFHPYPWLRERPNWTRRDSVRVAVQILEHIARLHARGVLLGDINAGNFLVDDNGRVSLVDCDSYQVEGFPCPVGHPNFVPPELQGVNFARTLRTEEHELFAVATLLFMTVVPGKAPYSHAGGTDVAADIRQGHFPYPLGKKGQDKAPEGVWRLCWSHLNRPLKEKFYASFHADHRDRPRVTVSEWLSEFREYARVLGRNANVFVGPKPQFGFDLSILPENFRYVPGRNCTPGDGPTDLQRFLDRLTAQVSGSATPAPPPASAVVPLTPAPKPAPAPNPQRTPAAVMPAPRPSARAAAFFSLFAAVYGSDAHPAVKACWKFHDRFLKRSAAGRLCSGAATLAGAPLAALVRCLPVSRFLLRPALAPFVGLFRAVTR